jgi:[acyl-carrier-protein] S-malonyltransferase
MEALTESRNCQPAIYTMSAACLAALREQLPDLCPAVCGGLSLGEFAALYAAGVLSFGNGLGLVAVRGRYMQEACRQTDGAMAAVLNADSQLVADVCSRCGIDVANYNCPGQIVISGEKSNVEAAVEALKEAGVSRVVMLNVDGAFHSRLMQPAADCFRNDLAQVTIAAPACQVVQNYAGGLVDDPERIRVNLEAQITGSVRWEECVQAMLDTGINALVEIGPGKVLCGFMKRIDRHFPAFSIGTAEELQQTIEQLRSC